MRITAIRGGCVLIGSLLLVLFSPGHSQPPEPTQWSSMGRDLSNTRSQPGERLIGTANASTLRARWVATTGGDVSATPIVDSDAVYVPDWAGNLYALNRTDGQVIWSHKIAEYNKADGSLSRVSPAIHGDDLILGDIKSASQEHNGAHIMAVKSTPAPCVG